MEPQSIIQQYFSPLYLEHLIIIIFVILWIHVRLPWVKLIKINNSIIEENLFAMVNIQIHL